MYLSQTRLPEIINSVKKLEPTKNEMVILFLGEKNAPNLLELQDNLLTLECQFIGGLFPSVISGEKNYEEGVVLYKLPITTNPIIVQGLNSDWSQETIQKFEMETKNQSILVLLDGLAENISKFLFDVFDNLGDSHNYFGGGAGSLSLVQQPCLFSNEGVFQDAAILCPVNLKSNLGVKHGWKSIHGPLIATRTEKNIVKELNWKPAFDVYKKVVEENTKETLSAENFFGIAKGFPFGMQKDGTETIVRDPLSVNENGELVCVGEVPQNSILEILEGNSEELIDAARLAARDCSNIEVKVEKALVFDCISRVLFLETNFEKELKAIQSEVNIKSKDVHFEGALTLGEISSHGQGTLEFLIKQL